MGCCLGEDRQAWERLASVRLTCRIHPTLAQPEQPEREPLASRPQASQLLALRPLTLPLAWVLQLAELGPLLAFPQRAPPSPQLQAWELQAWGLASALLGASVLALLRQRRRPGASRRRLPQAQP